MILVQKASIRYQTPPLQCSAPFIRHFIPRWQQIEDNSMMNNDQNGSHVVTPDARVRIRSQDLVQYVLHHLLDVFRLSQLPTHNVNQPLTVVHILLPNAVTTYQNELVLVGYLELFYVGVTSDHLLVVGETLVLLVVEICKGAGKIQASIDPAHTDVATCLLDSGLLFSRIWLVIFAEVDCLALPAEHGT